MRTFIAIDTPREIGNYLTTLQEKMKGCGSFTFPKSFHVTLKFLGEVSEQKIEKVKRQLAALRCDPFSATLSSVGAFPSLPKARVVWVGMKPEEPFMTLQQEIEKTLLPLGFPPDPRFHPHITLARVKAINDKKHFAECIKNMEVARQTFTVQSFALLQSVLEPQGPRYSVVQRFDLV